MDHGTSTYTISSICWHSPSGTTNYARWSTVYLAESEMSVLQPDVLEGNSVVKRTDRRFNHISADQSTEWPNATGKKSGGLVVITRVASALSRWTYISFIRMIQY